MHRLRWPPVSKATLSWSEEVISCHNLNTWPSCLTHVAFNLLCQTRMRANSRTASATNTSSIMRCIAELNLAAGSCTIKAKAHRLFIIIKERWGQECLDDPNSPRLSLVSTHKNHDYLLHCKCVRVRPISEQYWVNKWPQKQKIVWKICKWWFFSPSQIIIVPQVSAPIETPYPKTPNSVWTCKEKPCMRQTATFHDTSSIISFGLRMKS